MKVSVDSVFHVRSFISIPDKVLPLSYSTVVAAPEPNVPVFVTPKPVIHMHVIELPKHVKPPTFSSIPKIIDPSAINTQLFFAAPKTSTSNSMSTQADAPEIRTTPPLIDVLSPEMILMSERNAALMKRCQVLEESLSHAQRVVVPRTSRFELKNVDGSSSQVERVSEVSQHTRGMDRVRGRGFGDEDLEFLTENDRRRHETAPLVSEVALKCPEFLEEKGKSRSVGIDEVDLKGPKWMQETSSAVPPREYGHDFTQRTSAPGFGFNVRGYPNGESHMSGQLSDADLDRRLTMSEDIVNTRQLSFETEMRKQHADSIRDLKQLQSDTLRDMDLRKEHRAPYWGVTSRNARLFMEEGVTLSNKSERAEFREAFKRTADYKEASKYFAQLIKDGDPTLKSIDFGDNFSIATNCIKPTEDLLIDRMQSCPHTYISSKSTKMDVLKACIIFIDLIFAKLSIVTRQWFMKQTLVYNNFDLNIYYSIDKFFRFLKVNLEENHKPVDVFKKAEMLQLVKCKPPTFAQLYFDYKICMDANYDAPQTFTLTEQTFIDWLYVKGSIMLPMHLRIKIVELDEFERDIVTILRVMEVAEEIYGIKHHERQQPSRFNAIVGHDQQLNYDSSDDMDHDAEISAHLLAMPDFNRGGNNVIKNVTSHNGNFLNKFKPENRTSLTMVGQQFCWTCKKPDHRSYNCPENVGKTPPFPMPHKLALLKEFEGKTKPFSRYTHKNGRFNEIIGEIDSDYDNFVWIGEPGLHDKNDEEVSSSSLFLIC